MTRLPILLATLGLAVSPVCAQAPVTVPFKGAGGNLTLTAAPKGVLVHIEASGLAPGWHAVHFHEKADCSDAGFKLSGGHVHGAAALLHGLLNPAATDQGDLPNLYAGADGQAKAEFFTTALTLAILLDADGSALVIHARPDDFASQPIGGAGERVACAAIR